MIVRKNRQKFNTTKKFNAYTNISIFTRFPQTTTYLCQFLCWQKLNKLTDNVCVILPLCVWKKQQMAADIYYLTAKITNTLFP